MLLCPAPSPKELQDLQHLKDSHNFRMFMRQVLYSLGPFQAGKLVTLAGHAPNVENMFQEERFNYMVQNGDIGNIPVNDKGERLISLAEVDDRIVKVEPVDFTEENMGCKRIKKIDFVDLTDE